MKYDWLAGLLIIALMVGWGANIYQLASNTPPISEWEGDQIVCAVGIPVGPVGAVCGLFNIGSEG